MRWTSSLFYLQIQRGYAKSSDYDSMIMFFLLKIVFLGSDCVPNSFPSISWKRVDT